MTFFDSVVLGVVEGFTEFLPISSTGHLILASSILGIATSDSTKTFEIAIQAGAVVAVIIYYTKKILSNWSLIPKIIVAFIPTAIIGLSVYKLVKTYLLGNALIVVIALIVGGIVLWVIESYKKESTLHQELDEHEVTYREAIIIGLWQILAFIPGVSRSGATIIGGRLANIPKKIIIEFSFMLAIPTLLAATGLDLLHSYKTIGSHDVALLIVGGIVTCITALFSIKFLLSYIQKNSFKIFGVYRIVIGVAFLIYVLLT